MKLNIYLIFVLFHVLSCGNKEEADTIIEEESSYKIIANDDGIEYSIPINDSTSDIYNFHPNRKLLYYAEKINGVYEGEVLHFYNNGILQNKVFVKNGLKMGYSYYFYPSGRLKSIKNYVNDSVRGYYVDFYDKLNSKKAECMADPNDIGAYIYARTYDSITQEVINILDHRSIELEKHPSLNPREIQMPWEENNWYLYKIK